MLNRIVSGARVRIPLVRRVLEFKPTTIGRDRRWLEAEFARQGIDLGDADAALRQHGPEHVGQMKPATLEEDGSISVVPAADDEATRAGGSVGIVDSGRRGAVEGAGSAVGGRCAPWRPA